MLLTTGCIMRAHYNRPPVDVPDNWRLDADEASTIVNIQWWEQFNDPVLNNLIQVALENNNDLGVAVGRIYEFAAKLGVARSFQFPEINGTGAALRQELSLNTGPLSITTLDTLTPVPINISRTFNLFTTLLNLTYYVDIWGKVQNAVDASMSDLLGQIEARRSLVLTIVSEVAATYVILRQYDKQHEIAIDTYNARYDSYKLFEKRYEGGLISEMEVKQAEAEALTALVQVKELEILIPETENQLSILLGMNPGPIARGKLLENFTLPPQIPAGIPSDILEQRPDVMQAEEALIATNSRVAEAKTNFFPQISLTGSYGNQSSALHNLFTGSSRSWFFGADVFQQIFNAGRISYEVEIAQGLRMEAIYGYYSTIQNAFREVNDALVSHQINLELLQILEKQVEVLKDYLHLANLQYDNGQTDYLNVLDAETKLFASQLNLVQVQADVINSVIALYAALGGGWVVDADNEVVRPLPDMNELCRLGL